jgi:molybdopterin-guanine dinucleotide biosynthesis protein A
MRIKMIIDKINEIYNELFPPDQRKVDAIILSGTNPYKPVNGEGCKALIDYNGKPMVYHVIKAFSGCDDINNIVIVGPKPRLEDKLQPLLKEDNITNYRIVNENKPGDATQIVDNAIKSLDYLTSNSPWVLYSGCDIPRIRTDDIDIIMRDIIFQMIKDKKDGEVADIYWTMGRQIEDVSNYSGLTDIDRPGTVFNKDLLLRLGTVHLVNYKRVLPYADKIKEALSHRKIKKHPIKSFRYGKKLLGKKGFSSVVFLGLNYLKKYGPLPIRGALTFYPYISVPVEFFEERVSEGLGFKVKTVVTTGSSDIDEDKEYKTLIRKSRTKSRIKKIATSKKFR